MLLFNCGYRIFCCVFNPLGGNSSQPSCTEQQKPLHEPFPTARMKKSRSVMAVTADDVSSDSNSGPVPAPGSVNELLHNSTQRQRRVCHTAAL